VTSEITASRTGSSVRRRMSVTTLAIAAPMTVPPPASTMNSPPAEPQPTATDATATLAATRNSTSEVASLNRLSACTRTWTFGGSASRLPSAVTATGSVLASTAPSTNASCQDSGVTAEATAPTAAAEASTRPTDRTPTGFQTRRSSRQDSSSALA
jgi:hypothetical protein